MIVVVIIGVLAAMAVPYMNKVRRDSQNTAFINDMRILKDVVQIYITEHETPPPDTLPGQLPVVLAPYLPNSFSFDETPIGGQWDYENWNSSMSAQVRIGVSVIGPNRDDGGMREIDRRFDDGSLGGGQMLKTKPGIYTYKVAGH